MAKRTQDLGLYVDNLCHNVCSILGCEGLPIIKERIGSHKRDVATHVVIFYDKYIEHVFSLNILYEDN